MKEGGPTTSVEVRDNEEVGRARHSRKPNRLAHAGTVKVSAGHCSKVPKSARHGLEYAVVGGTICICGDRSTGCCDEFVPNTLGRRALTSCTSRGWFAVFRCRAGVILRIAEGYGTCINGLGEIVVYRWRRSDRKTRWRGRTPARGRGATSSHIAVAAAGDFTGRDCHRHLGRGAGP